LEIVEGASGQGDTVTRGDAKDIWFKSRGKGDMGICFFKFLSFIVSSCKKAETHTRIVVVLL